MFAFCFASCTKWEETTRVRLIYSVVWIISFGNDFGLWKWVGLMRRDSKMWIRCRDNHLSYLHEQEESQIGALSKMRSNSLNWWTSNHYVIPRIRRSPGSPSEKVNLQSSLITHRVGIPTVKTRECFGFFNFHMSMWRSGAKRLRKIVVFQGSSPSGRMKSMSEYLRRSWKWCELWTPISFSNKRLRLSCACHAWTWTS